MLPNALLDIPSLKESLLPLTRFLNLNVQVSDLLILAAENEWCPIAALHAAGHLQKMSAWQIYNLYNGVLKQYFPLDVHTLTEGSGFAIIHQTNGNCVIGDGDGKVDIQVISTLDYGFINYLAHTRVKPKYAIPAGGFAW